MVSPVNLPAPDKPFPSPRPTRVPSHQVRDASAETATSREAGPLVSRVDSVTAATAALKV